MTRTTVVAMLVLAALVAVPARGAAPPDPAAALAGTIAREVEQRLVATVAVARTAAREAPTRSERPEAMREFLADRARWVPHVLHVAFIDDKGVVRAIGPGYRFLEGTDLSGKEWVKSALAVRKPMVSKAFLSLEGFYAVAVLAPVVRSGRFVGLVSVTIRPTALLREWVEAARGRQPFDVWVMETGGRLLYDPDPEEVGKNLLEDRLYAPHPDLVKAGRAIAAARQAILGKLEQTLATQGPKAVIGNHGYARFLTVRKGSMTINQQAVEDDARLDGKFVLRTSTDLTPEEVARAYKSLWRVERTFRETKSTLDVRPLFHHTDQPTIGHIVACFLALRLEVHLQRKLDERGSQVPWPNLMRDLGQVQAIDLELDGERYRLRKDLQGSAYEAFVAAGVRPPATVTHLGKAEPPPPGDVPAADAVVPKPEVCPASC